MNIFDQLIRDEGLRTHPYEDTTGNLTIGVGRNLNGKGLTGEECVYLLQNDVQELTMELNGRLPWLQALDPVRQAVIQNMAFNLGIGGLEKFPKLLMAAARGDWETAAAEMLASEWAPQVGDRAKRLAQQIQTGEWV